MKVSQLRRTGWTALLPFLKDRYAGDETFYLAQLPAAMVILRRKDKEVLRTFLSSDEPLRLRVRTAAATQLGSDLARVIRRLRQADCRAILTTRPL